MMDCVFFAIRVWGFGGKKEKNESVNTHSYSLSFFSPRTQIQKLGGNLGVE